MGVPTDTTRREGQPAVAARFAAMPDAREGIVALQRAGVDADDIQLLGDRVVAANRPADPEPVDRRGTRFVAQRVLKGVLIGGVIGAVVGTIVGFVLVAIADGLSTPAWAVLSCTFVAAMLGAAVGALASVERGVGISDAWPTTFQDAPPDGPVWVVVYTRERAIADRAADALGDHALELTRN